MTTDTVLKLRNTMRLIAAASAVVVATGAGSAFARVSLDASNDVTGAESVQTNIVDYDNDLEVDVRNTVDVDEDVTFDATTGDNDVEENTIVDGVETGEITADIAFANEANGGVDLGDIAFGDSDVEADFSNSITGAFSENENRVDVDNDVDVTLRNEADIDTDVNLDLNTGGNNISRNTQVDGDVTTGDIDVSIEQDNEVNSGASLDLGGLGGSEVDITAENNRTGFRSENVNRVDVDNDVTLDVRNEANIDTNIEVDANSGDNDVSRNTIVGNVETGGINFSYSGRNSANNR